MAQCQHCQEPDAPYPWNLCKSCYFNSTIVKQYRGKKAAEVEPINLGLGYIQPDASDFRDPDPNRMISLKEFNEMLEREWSYDI